MSTFPGAVGTSEQPNQNPFKKEIDILRRNASVAGPDAKIRSGNFTPRGQHASGSKFDSIFGQKAGGAGTQFHRRK